jgi:hydrophobic/amphiphilic exporter-1 (mainly G- bacteria), HAE1 family
MTIMFLGGCVMKITELSVQKPVALIMITLLILGMGIFGYSKLGADLFPSADVPVVTVITKYPGASSEEIKKDVVKPIEESLSELSGIDTMRSGAAEGYGYTTIMFTMETDMITAFMDVQQALGDISNELPEDAAKPVINKFDKNAEPVMMLSISGEIPFDQLYNESDKVKQALEKLQGVAGVSLEGAEEKRLAIKLDKAAIEYYGIGVNTVVQKLASENWDIPVGQLQDETSTKPVRVLGEFENIDDVKSMQIPLTGGGTVRLGDVSDISLERPDNSESIRFNGTNSIGIFVHKRSDANVVQTTKLIKKELKDMESSLPSGIKLTIADDKSAFINSTLKEINLNLIEGVITTSLVMFLFLRHVRSSLIILVSIPTSLIATFLMMYILGFTMNLLSMLGLSVCIGILVDDSIVVLENIQRHLSQGKSLIRAAIDGRNEIGMAAISITLCDIVVFGPVAFMSGMIGQFFKEFGLTVVFAALFSLIVSFTLTPMMASRLLKEKDSKENESKEPTSGKQRKLSIFSRYLESAVVAYKNLLVWSLNNRIKIIGIVILGIVLSVSLIPLKVITTEFIPVTDQGKLTISVELSPGSTIHQTDNKVKTIEEHLKTMPEVENYLSQIGSEQPSSASIIVNLITRNKRDKSEGEIVQELRKWGSTIPGINFTVNQSSFLGVTSADGAKPVAIKLTGIDTEVLKDISKDIEETIKTVPGIRDVSNTLQASQPEIAIKLDRLAASQYNINPFDVVSTLKAITSEGTDAGVYRQNGDEFDIVVSFKANQVITTTDIENTLITNSYGQKVALNQIARAYISDSPQTILRQDRKDMVTVSANVEGRTLGEVTGEIQQKLDEKTLPYGYEISYGGDLENMEDSFGSLIKALIVSIVLVYMILAVLYESFLTPLLRMLSLPCGIIGALFALALTGKSLSIVSMIGLIMLDGLASKNGTLLIDYTNTLMKRGMNLKEALMEAGTSRLRPIIMTSITMIVGMLPTALAMGDGSEIKSGMGIVLIGGMVTSTILSPILIPVAYTLLEDARKAFRGKRERKLNNYEGAKI